MWSPLSGKEPWWSQTPPHPKSDHTRLAHSSVTLSEAKGLKRQILRYAQNDNAG
jgi:hypothetical protein